MTANFKDSTVYQIYIKSFYDSNGDGIGDLNGIRSKLSYIKSLGVKYIWVTPFFCSPMNDNGYDVSDYRNVNPMFGTMSDCEKMIEEAAKLDLGFMFDMVFNHTSTEHEWFRKALSGDKKYMNYYLFEDNPPDWTSIFGGSAWEYVPELGKYYLHLFDKTQADLNWENPEVREELKEVIRFWKDKGVKGFRFDVINRISKPENFASQPSGPAGNFCRDGRHVHEFIHELVADTGIDSMITVGEMASTTIENCIKYTNPERHELSMTFSFHHLKTDYKDGDKWSLMPTDLVRLREIFKDWQEIMTAHGGWNALFWCNHDQPRIVSRLGDEGQYWKQSAKMLATFLHILRGTPYIFQGEELGMTNAHFDAISQYQDVEAKNYYAIMLSQGRTKSDALNVLSQRSRDNGRTPMQWNSGKNAGFTQGKSWLEIPDNHTYINVESEENDAGSILNYYRELVKLRKEYKVISDGQIRFLDTGSEKIFAYERTLGSERLFVICSFSPNEESMLINIPEGKVIISNYEDVVSGKLRPYEAKAIYSSR